MKLSGNYVALWITGFAGIAMGLFYHMQLWQMGADGLSVVSHTTPFWDFNNLWSGGYFARIGNVDWLFDPDIYRRQMRFILGEAIPDQEWSYPPSMLLVGVPLSVLPIFPAYILWTGGTVALLHFALRPYQLAPLAHWAIILSPAIFINGLFGQNGALLAALMLAGLFHLRTHPVFAGICFGLMTIKPQYGILLPVLLIASGNWKAFIWAAITGLLLFVLTAWAFGFDVWLKFMEFTRPMMTSIMEAPYIQPYHTNAIPVFVFARALGADIVQSYGVQAGISAVAIMLTYWYWRPSSPVSGRQRIALTCVLAILVTPYAYTYDMVIICAAMIMFFNRPPALSYVLILIPLWLFPLYSHILAALYRVNIGAVVIGGILLVLMMHWKRQNQKPVGVSSEPSA